MSDFLSAPLLGDALCDPSLSWQLHNCKLSQKTLRLDAPLPLLAHYDALSDDLKSLRPLSTQTLKLMDTPMQRRAAAETLGVDVKDLANPWHVKYVGAMVIYYEPLLLALRLCFSNTAKRAQTVHTSDPRFAWDQECQALRVFGVIDVLNKNTRTPIRLSANDTLPVLTQYAALNAEYSLALGARINETQDAAWLRAAKEHLRLACPLDE